MITQSPAARSGPKIEVAPVLEVPDAKFVRESLSDAISTWGFTDIVISSGDQTPKGLPYVVSFSFRSRSNSDLFDGQVGVSAQGFTGHLIKKSSDRLRDISRSAATNLGLVLGSFQLAVSKEINQSALSGLTTPQTS